MKRLVSLMLAVMLLAGALPLCASAAEEPTEISIALWEMDTSFLEADDAVYKYLCDRFNIRINPIPLTWDDYTEKVNTWVAADDMPDVFNINMLDGANKTFKMWVQDEMVRPLPDDLSKYPNLEKICALPEVKATMVNGKYWCIPRCKADGFTGQALIAQGGCYYRKDWAQKLGLKEPETVDEFIEFARAMVNGDPDGNGVNDTVGVTSYDWDFLTRYIWGGIEKNAFNQWELDANGKLYRAVDDEHTFEAANTIRQMYDEGLIDQDISFQDTDAGFVKFATNKAAILPFQMYQNDHYIFDKFTANNPGVNIEDAIGYLKPLKNKYDGKYYYNTGLNYWAEIYVSYKVDDAKHAKILELLDFCSSDEYLDIVRHGLEGVDYKREGDQIVYLTEDGKRPNLLKKYPFLNGFKFMTIWDEGPAFFAAGTNYPYSARIIQEFFDWTVANGTPKPICVAYSVTLTPLREAYVDESTDLIKQFMFSKSGNDPKADWQALQERLQANGLNEMVAEVQATGDAEGIQP